MSGPSLSMLASHMEALGLSFMAASLESYFAEAERAEKPLLESVADLLDLEYTPRKERTARTRLKLSGIPEPKRLEDFGLSWLKGGLTERRFAELASLSFIERKENVILLGPSGTGKTHLLPRAGGESVQRRLHRLLPELHSGNRGSRPRPGDLSPEAHAHLAAQAPPALAR